MKTTQTHVVFRVIFFQNFLKGFFNFDAQATEGDRKTDQISKQYFAFYVFQR